MIYLIRHGLDDETKIGGYSNVGLTEVGIKQIYDTAQYIKNKDFKIDKIISSDIIRARESSNILSNILNLDIEYTSLLRELDKGDLTGMDKNIAKIKYPKYFDNLTIYDKYPNGEAMIEFYNKIKNRLEYIMSLDNTLLVTHRGVINMIYYILNDIPVDMDKKRFGVTHASLHELDAVKRKIKKIK